MAAQPFFVADYFPAGRSAAATSPENCIFGRLSSSRNTGKLASLRAAHTYCRFATCLPFMVRYRLVPYVW